METVRDRIYFMASYFRCIIGLEGEVYERISKALLRYMFLDEEPELSPLEMALFEAMRSNIDKSKEIMVKRCESGRKGGKANRGQTEANHEQMEANGSKTKANGTDKDIDKDIDIDKDKDGDVDKDVDREEDKDKKQRFRAEDEIKDPEVLEAWKAFVESRRKNRKAMTNNAERLMVKKLFSLASDAFGELDAGKAVRILEAAVMNSWTGLYDPDEKKSSNKAIDWDAV